MDFRRYDIIGYNENTILQNPKMNRLLRRHQGIYIKKVRSHTDCAYTTYEQ